MAACASIEWECGAAASAAVPPASYGEAVERPLEFLVATAPGRGGAAEKPRGAAPGPLRIGPGCRAIFAARTAVSAREWTLLWKSSGRIRIRMMQLGSAETLQLSDNVEWDDVEDPVPPGYAERTRALSPWIMRYNFDIKWPISYPATSGVFFFEVSPAGDDAVEFGDASLRYRPMAAPAAAATGGAGFTDYPAEGLVGAVEITHVAGFQPTGAPDALAEWLYVYEDGTTAPAFATLRWNSGVAAEGMIESPTTPDGTWFGPPGFAWGDALRCPANRHGTHWTAQYRWTFVNEHPERPVRCIRMRRMPGDTRDYNVLAVKPIPAGDFSLALVEPAESVLETGVETAVNVYRYRAAGDGVVGERRREPVVAMKAEGGRSQCVGEVAMGRSGRFEAGAGSVSVDGGVIPGGITLGCGGASSCRLSLLPPPLGGEKPFHYTMICGGADHIRDFDRMRRAGFDEAKIHIPMKVAPDGSWDLGRWDWHVEKIARAGMDVSIRNTFTLPAQFANGVEALRGWSGGAECPPGKVFWQNDPTSALYREKLVDFYECMGRLSARHSNVRGINASYGQRCVAARPGAEPVLVWTQSRLEAFRRWREARGRSSSDISPQSILDSRELLSDYTRFNEETLSGLARDICRAVRRETDRPHLAFNVNFHPVEDKLLGETFGEYLRCGMEFGPASLFHETSERYSLSFLKWLAAARTCGLPYGDECGQNPPSYEQAAMAYMWMGMMQCYESCYCQWYGGRPATQNLAQFKAYHRMLMDAEYTPDPVCLALSLETGFDEAPDTLRAPLHSRAMPHYGLATLLRELNVNADRYMIDALPELDANVRSRLLIDDNTRSMPPDFADRIEAFVRGGGVFLASSLTDAMNGRAFLKRFGIDFEAEKAKAAPDDPFPFCEVDAGAGKVAVLLKSWSAGWEPGRPDPERRKALALLARLGAFEPLVSSSHPCVFATPYRDRDGDALVSVINITCLPRTVDIGLSKALAGESAPTVLNCDTGLASPAVLRDGRWTAEVRVPALGMTLLKVTRK